VLWKSSGPYCLQALRNLLIIRALYSGAFMYLCHPLVAHNNLEKVLTVGLVILGWWLVLVVRCCLRIGLCYLRVGLIVESQDFCNQDIQSCYHSIGWSCPRMLRVSITLAFGCIENQSFILFVKFHQQYQSQIEFGRTSSIA
jgi:hypothetical protein